MVAMSRRLIHHDAARQELEVAATVDEVKEIHDQSEALRTYGRQIHDAELEAWSAEINLRARARIGELSEDLERTDQATRLIGPGKHGNPLADAHGKHAILREAGISSQVANRCEQVHRIFERDADKVEALISRKRAKKEPITEKQILQIGWLGDHARRSG